MSGDERVAIQNVVKGRQPKLIQLAVESESESEGEITVEEGEVPSPPGPPMAALEPVTTIHEDSDTEPPMMRVSAVWSEAPASDSEGVSPPRASPPSGKKCPDCAFTCKLQIQMNRHKAVCKKDSVKFPVKKWKMKIKSEESVKKPLPIVNKSLTIVNKSLPIVAKVVPAAGVKADGSAKKPKKSPYVEPGKGHPCKECGKEFRNEATLARHFEDIHQAGEFPCPGDTSLCGKVFTSKNKMSSHYSRNCNPNNPAGAIAIARRRASMA